MIYVLLFHFFSMSAQAFDCKALKEQQPNLPVQCDSITKEEMKKSLGQCPTLDGKDLQNPICLSEVRISLLKEIQQTYSLALLNIPVKTREDIWQNCTLSKDFLNLTSCLSKQTGQNAESTYLLKKLNSLVKSASLNAAKDMSDRVALCQGSNPISVKLQKKMTNPPCGDATQIGQFISTALEKDLKTHIDWIGCEKAQRCAFTKHPYKPIKRDDKGAYNNGYLYPRNEKLVLNSELLGQCFARELQKLSANGTKIVWENYDREATFQSMFSSDAKYQSRGKYPQLGAFLMGSPSTMDYRNGHEEELLSWVMQQADNSISPVELFRKSLKLNEGNASEAIFLIHNLLRNEARHYRSWVEWPSTMEKMHLFYNKFIDIRGDLEERGVDFNGDHRGNWYRIWGTMVYYINETDFNAEDPNQTFCKPAIAGRLEGEVNLLDTNFRAVMAEVFKYVTFYATDTDDRKIEINKKGGEIAHEMIQSAMKPLPSGIDELCEKEKYLIPVKD